MISIRNILLFIRKTRRSMDVLTFYGPDRYWIKNQRHAMPFFTVKKRSTEVLAEPALRREWPNAMPRENSKKVICLFMKVLSDQHLPVRSKKKQPLQEGPLSDPALKAGREFMDTIRSVST